MKYTEIYVLSYIAIVNGHYDKELKHSLNDKLSMYIGRSITTFYDSESNKSHIRVSIDSVSKFDRSILTLIHDTVKTHEDIISNEMFILSNKVPIHD